MGDVTATENVPGDLAHFREILMKRRQEILDNQKPIADSMIDTNTRQGDMADQANGNNEVHIHLKLKQTDAKILRPSRRPCSASKQGTYGVCRDCGDEIAEARLERDSLDARVHHLQGKAEGVTSHDLDDDPWRALGPDAARAAPGRLPRPPRAA